MEKKLRMSRRALLQAMGVAGGAAVLAACAPATSQSGGQAPAGDEPAGGSGAPAAAEASGEFSMWVFPLGQDDMASLWQPLITRFASAYPNITPNIELLPWDGRREKMLTAFAGGEAPAMAYVNTDTVSLFGMNGLLLPLDDIIPAEAWDDMAGDLSIGLSWGGKRIMYPCLLLATGELYNKGLCQEIGWDPEKAPYTWDDIRAIGPMAKEKELYTTQLSTADWETFIDRVWQAGGSIFDPDVTKVTLNSDPVVEVVEFYKQQFEEGWVPKEGAVGTGAEASAASTVNHWIDKRSVMSGRGNADITTNTSNQAPDIDYDIVPTVKYKEQVQTGGAGCWGLFANAKGTEAARVWLNWLIEPEQQGFYGSVTKFAPPRKSAYDFWAAEPMPRKWYEIRLPYLRMNQDVTYFYNESAVVWRPHLQAAVLGMETVEEALETATAEIQVFVDEWNATRK
ncbi:MAG: ABC transporter substrate-binding protein [Anaerolineae bacterium]